MTEIGNQPGGELLVVTCSDTIRSNSRSACADTNDHNFWNAEIASAQGFLQILVDWKLRFSAFWTRISTRGPKFNKLASKWSPF